MIVLVSMLAGALTCSVGALTEAIRRNWTVFVWHSLGNLQADSCLEYQGTRASLLAARLEVHRLFGSNALLPGDIGDRHLELDDEDCRCKLDGHSH